MPRTIEGPPTSNVLAVPQMSVTEVPSGALRKSSNGVPSVAMSTPPPMHQKLALERTLSSRHSPTLPPHNETEYEHREGTPHGNHVCANNRGFAPGGPTTTYSPPSRSAPAHSPRGGATMSSTAGHVPALMSSSMTVQNAGIVTAAILNGAEVAAHCENLPAGPSHTHTTHTHINVHQQTHSSPAVEEAGPGSQWVVEVTVHEARDLPTPPQRSRGVRDVFCCASLLHQQTDLTVRSCHACICMYVYMYVSHGEAMSCHVATGCLEFGKSLSQRSVRLTVSECCVQR
jgi:hypothetical protein